MVARGHSEASTTTPATSLSCGPATDDHNPAAPAGPATLKWHIRNRSPQVDGLHTMPRLTSRLGFPPSNRHEFTPAEKFRVLYRQAGAMPFRCPLRVDGVPPTYPLTCGFVPGGVTLETARGHPNGVVARVGYGSGVCGCPLASGQGEGNEASGLRGSALRAVVQDPGRAPMPTI
jgi:hypothetical protein